MPPTFCKDCPNREHCPCEWCETYAEYTEKAEGNQGCLSTAKLLLSLAVWGYIFYAFGEGVVRMCER